MNSDARNGLEKRSGNENATIIGKAPKMTSEDIYKVGKYKEAVKKGITSGKWKALESWYVDLSSNIDAFNGIPQDFFQEILRLMNLHDFLSADGSHNVLRYLQYDWDIFSESQQESLLATFEKAYPQFQDGLSKLLITEMISEQYNEAALQLLKNILMSCEDDEYGMVLMGIYRIAKNGFTVELRKDAKLFLTTLVNDASSTLSDAARKLLRALGSD